MPLVMRANEMLDQLEREIEHHAVSSGGDKGLVEWTCDGRVFVLARTKSEARAAYKKVTGKPIPKGMQFRRRVDGKGK